MRILENGEEVCNNQAENGSPYCSYHKKMLDDAYNSIIATNVMIQRLKFSGNIFQKG